MGRGRGGGGVKGWVGGPEKGGGKRGGGKRGAEKGAQHLGGGWWEEEGHLTSFWLSRCITGAMRPLSFNSSACLSTSFTWLCLSVLS